MKKGNTISVCILICAALLASSIPAATSDTLVVQIIEEQILLSDLSAAIGTIRLERQTGIIPYLLTATFTPGISPDILSITWTLSVSFHDTSSISDNVVESFEGLTWSTYCLSTDAMIITMTVNFRDGESAQWGISVPELTIDSDQQLLVNIAMLGAAGIDCSEQPMILRQLHMARDDLEYMTEFEAHIQARQSGWALTFSYAGRYVFEVVDHSAQATRIEIWVHQQTSPDKTLWLFMLDLWNNETDPWDPLAPTTSFFDDEDVVRTVRYLHEQGIINLAIAQNLKYRSADPIEIVKWAQTIPDEDLNWLLPILLEPEGAKLLVQLQVLIMDGNPDYIETLRETLRTTSDLGDWFHQYAGFVSELAELLERHGVQYYNYFNLPPLVWFGEMPPAVRALCQQEWLDLFRDTAFAGKVGVGDYVYHESAGRNIPANLLAASDFAIINIMENTYCDNLSCSVTHVKERMTDTLAKALSCLDGSQSQENFVMFRARSNSQSLLGAMPREHSGQYVESTTPDFRAQVLALEGSLQAFLAMPEFQHAVVTPEYWRMLDYSSNEDLESWIEEQMMIDGSLIGKPGFSVYKMYNGMINAPLTLVAPSLEITHIEDSQPEAAIINQQSETSQTSDTSLILPYEVDSVVCSTVIDRFDSSGSFRDRGWSIDFDSNEFHEQGSDPAALCEFSTAGNNNGNLFLRVDYSNHSWMAVRYWGSQTFDASRYTGLQITLWTLAPARVDITLGVTTAQGDWIGARLPTVQIDANPRTFRFPFNDFVVEDSSGRLLRDHLDTLVALAIHLPRDSGVLFVDDICLYDSSE